MNREPEPQGEVNRLLWLSVLWLILTVSDIAAMVILTAAHAPISWKFALIHPLAAAGWIGLAVAWFLSRRTPASGTGAAELKDDLVTVG